jgi:hypothetical protein
MRRRRSPRFFPVSFSCDRDCHSMGAFAQSATEAHQSPVAAVLSPRLFPVSLVILAFLHEELTKRGDRVHSS